MKTPWVILFLSLLFLAPPQVATASPVGNIPWAIRKAHQQQAAEELAAWKSRWPLGYNPAASVVVLPLTPLSPTSAEECSRYRDNSTDMIKDVAMHHAACLNSTASDRRPYSWTDFKERECSNSRCESLHRAMGRLSDQANAGFERCMKALQGRR